MRLFDCKASKHWLSLTHCMAKTEYQKSLFVLVHVEPFQDRVSFRCFFLSTILSILCVPLSSILLCLRHFLLSMTCVFLAMSLSGAAQQVTTTDSAILTSPLRPVLFHKRSSGLVLDPLPFRVCPVSSAQHSALYHSHRVAGHEYFHENELLFALFHLNACS